MEIVQINKERDSDVMKYYILFNPKAGNNHGSQNIPEGIDKEGAVQIDITTIESYSELFSSLEQDDKLVICGGDGTLNRFVNDTEGIPLENDVLYYPSGTGNDFSTDIGMTDVKEPFSIKKYISDLPTVEVNGKRYRFLNNVGFGIDGYCCEVGDELKKNSDEPVNYTAIAIKGLLFDYKPRGATVTVDGKEYRFKKVWIAPTMKGRYYGGGMMPTPEQDRNDPEGTLSLMLFYGKGKLKTLTVFPSIFKGEHVKHKNMVAVLKGKDISVRFDSPASVQVDGETILGVTEYRAVSNVKALEKQDPLVI